MADRRNSISRATARQDVESERFVDRLLCAKESLPCRLPNRLTCLMRFGINAEIATRLQSLRSEHCRTFVRKLYVSVPHNQTETVLWKSGITETFIYQIPSAKNDSFTARYEVDDTCVTRASISVLSAMSWRIDEISTVVVREECHLLMGGINDVIHAQSFRSSANYNAPDTQ